MKDQTFGSMIAALRKEKGMTQLELAQMMGVTDKAVSKWERDLSYPDVNSIPKLAEIFGVTVDQLMQVRPVVKENAPEHKAAKIAYLVLKAVALAMGVAVATLSALDKIDPNTAIGMLGVGLGCIGITQLKGNE